MVGSVLWSIAIPVIPIRRALPGHGCRTPGGTAAEVQCDGTARCATPTASTEPGALQATGDLCPPHGRDDRPLVGGPARGEPATGQVGSLGSRAGVWRGRPLAGRGASSTGRWARCLRLPEAMPGSTDRLNLGSNPSTI